MEITDTLVIDAPTERVWQLNTTVQDWPRLSPQTMTSVRRLDDGPLRLGSQARIKQPGQPSAVWTVQTLEAGRAFSWSTRRAGLTMTGSHLVEPAGSGCRNTLRLSLTGPLAPLVGLLAGRMVRRALRLENAGFKAAAERQAATA